MSELDPLWIPAFVLNVYLWSMIIYGSWIMLSGKKRSGDNDD